ncbi:MAG: biotin--[acetyl-CoA-carboxylase] ligase [Limnohabitans sp.]|nr:biotin--[acetyl-CoA-carboxylase] ligase [Limnohabitans sp.]
MKIIKLSAIDSTNDFLKKLISSQEVENLTIITAKKQTNGRGQMGASWDTEEDKNLITSILIKELINNTQKLFELNIAIAISIIEALKKIDIPDLSIKWPNDIMSGNKKIAGILIENSIKENDILSIIGIGLNVNQTNFENLPKASSLKVITGNEFDLEDILIKIIERIKDNIENIRSNNSLELWEKYHYLLFKIGKPIVFENENQGKFMGIIKKVNKNGLLEVQLEDDSIQTYGIKEITMIY